VRDVDGLEVLVHLGALMFESWDPDHGAADRHADAVRRIH
jgi:shikimate 5-dehydrogenase